MTDKEMIEEMARVIFERGVALDGTDFVFGLNGSDHFERIATAIYNAGYRKIPEGSVVLSNHKYKQDFCSQFNKGYERGSKETTKKFVNLSDSDILVVDTQEYGEIEVVSVERLQEIARELGVEIKE